MIARAALILTLALTGCILLISAAPLPVTALHMLLTPPQGCDAPCFLGVQPGYSAEQAITHLEQYPAISNIHLYQSFTGPVLSYQWNGLAQGFSLNQGRVVEPLLPLNSLLGDVWLALGQPDNIQALAGYDSQRHATLVFRYHAVDLALFVRVDSCNLNQAPYWYLPLRQNYTTGYTLIVGASDSQLSLVPLDTTTWASQLRDYCYAGGL